MSEAMFRIGACYKQRDGVVVLLRSASESPMPEMGDGFAWACYEDTRMGIGFRNLIDGSEASPWKAPENRDLLPGELTLRDGQWVPLGAQQEKATSMTPTLDAMENARDPKRDPLPYFAERKAFDPFGPGFVVKYDGHDSDVRQPFAGLQLDAPQSFVPPQQKF